MPHRAYEIAIVVSTFALFAAATANAQQAAGIGARARVVRSVVPESQKITESSLRYLEQVSIESESVPTPPVISSGGYVHVFTEYLAKDPAREPIPVDCAERFVGDERREILRITAAYTAN